MTIISIGIGNQVSRDELVLIASKPASETVFRMSSFDDLLKELGNILASACHHK